MVYNVENLFDDRHDGTEFNEFDPSRGTWNQELFEQRIDSIAEVVRKAVPGDRTCSPCRRWRTGTPCQAGLRWPSRPRYTSAVLFERRKRDETRESSSRLPVSRVHSHHVDRWNEGALRDIVEIEVEKSGRTLHLSTTTEVEDGRRAGYRVFPRGRGRRRRPETSRESSRRTPRRRS